jgi:hypothetical protein
LWNWQPSTGVAAAELDPQQLLVALVQLVVADGGRGGADRVEELDRRLVVEQRGRQRRGADVVAAAEHQRVALLGAQLPDVGGQEGRAAGVDGGPRR